MSCQEINKIRRIETMNKKIFLGLLMMIFLGPTFSSYDVEAAPAKNIIFWSDQSEPWQQEVIKGMISEFESKNPDVKVEAEYISFKDRQAKMTAALAGGILPEVALLSSQYATSLPTQGVMASLDDVVKDLGGANSFFGASLSLAAYEGHYYSLPYSTIPVVLWYRKDLLNKQGLRVPETWDDLLKTAKALTEQGAGKYFGLGIPYGRGEWTDEAFRIVALWPAGGKVLDKADNVIFNSPETVRALSFYKSLYPYVPTGSESWGYTETMNSFVSGTAAMAIYYGRTLKNLEQFSPDILSNTGAAIPPKDKYQATSNPPQSIGVFKNSKYPDIGKEFLKFFLTSDHYVKFLWATPGHNLPVLKSKASAWRQQPLLQKYPEIVDILLKANEPTIGFSPTKEPGLPSASLYWQAIRGSNVIPDAVQRVTLKNEDPKKAAEWAEKELKKIIAESKPR
jgi:multiple sugar transport system substrate-binding protein